MSNELINPFLSRANNKPAANAVANTDQDRAVAEVQAAMMIARMNPRDQIAAMDRILNACTRPTLANAAVYSYARGGSDVSGPSIRLAEAMAQAWGNMQFGIRELEQSNGESVVQAFAWDVETNTRVEKTFCVPHTRSKNEYVAGKKTGKKINERLDDSRDIYEMVANQGARRLRACILSVIPGDVTEAAMEQCDLTMKSSADTSPEAIQNMLKRFEKFGVTKDQIETRIQRRLEAIQPAQIVALRKIFTSMKDGMSSAADWFEGNFNATSASQEPKPPAQPPEMPQEAFDNDLAKWTAIINTGKKTAQDIINMICTRSTLSNEQVQTLLAIQPQTTEQE